MTGFLDVLIMDRSKEKFVQGFQKKQFLFLIAAMSISFAAAKGDCIENVRWLKEWEFYKGDLGGTWEALRPQKQSRLPDWEKVSLPHCFNATDAVSPYQAYYQGPAWYRKPVQIDNPYPDGRTFVHFDGSGQKTKLYVEDRLIGEHIGGYDEFEFDITEAIEKYGHKLNLLVRCDNSRDVEMIPSDLSDFTIYGGLYRSVSLIYRPRICVGWPVINTTLDSQGTAGTVDFLIKAQNPSGLQGDLAVTLELTDDTGKSVWTMNTQLTPETQEPLKITATLLNPHRWSPSRPHLYRWKLTSTYQGGDMYCQCGKLGFRHFRFEEKGPFYLNNRRLLLKGTHRHEDHAGLGAAMPDDLIGKEMELIKSAGFNFIRLGHYQQNRTVLELCDELGLLVWEEIPWCRGGLGSDRYKEQARRMLKNMITQHRHHPSIIIWGLGNENDWRGDFQAFNKTEIKNFMAELNDLAHQLDPSRKTAIRRCAFCSSIVDVYSPSIWAGWYRGKYTDYKEVSFKEMNKVPHFLHAEWGASQHARRHSENPDRGLEKIAGGFADERAGDYLMTGGSPRVSRDGDWTETYACNLIDWHLKEQENMPWLTGSAYWPFKDFSTPIRPDNPIPYVNQKGIVERDLTPKESFYVFQSYWGKEPMVHLYGHSWPVRYGKTDEPKMVKVYSNCESVELFLNGRSMGTRIRNSQDFPAAGLRWRTVFPRGQNTLRAVGLHQGKTIEDEFSFEYQTDSWTKPDQLSIELLCEPPDQVTVQVYAHDQQGIRCLDATNVVEFSIIGSGELIADGGTSTASRKLQLYNGRAQISAKKNWGSSVICVKSKGLSESFLQIK